MKRLRAAVAVFLLAAGIPFLASFTFFVVSQQRSLLTEPETYMARLKRDGAVSHMVSLGAWKRLLARDELCRAAEAVVIGSSRVREIDSSVTRTSTCNLYVDGLSARGFASLTRELPAVPSGQRRLVYVGIDHFWLWVDRDELDGLELRLLGLSRTLWRVWALLRPLGYFTSHDLLEAIRRVQQPHRGLADELSVWYPDGHLLHPRYYALKRSGKQRHFDRQAIEESVAKIFSHGQLQQGNVRALEHGLRTLHGKGYAVRLFWNPVSPEHIAVARRRHGRLFQDGIDTVDQLAASLPLDRYVPASRTLDPTSFGCTERDYFDLTHMDVDCLQRVFAEVLIDTPGSPRAMLYTRPPARCAMNQPTVRLIPARNPTAGLKPNSACARCTSRQRRGWPFGFVTSQAISPSNSTSSAMMRASWAIEISSPLPTLTGSGPS
jgi:hypothetical protein